VKLQREGKIIEANQLSRLSKMISKTDIEIYSEIFQEKSITEKYLGYASFDWIYSSVKYTADCTLAIPFDLFDKVIVGILSVDEVLSIEQIGEILGNEFDS
jgi:hypothetical protein